MADEPRQPVAVRVVRPYTSLEEFLAYELETITKTSVVLIGAPAKPQGVVLKFELVLSDGKPLLRGEGRVVAFQPSTNFEQPGLTLRFTRLDSSSKAIIDRATKLRDEKAKAGADAVYAERQVSVAPQGIMSLAPSMAPPVDAPQIHISMPSPAQPPPLPVILSPPADVPEASPSGSIEVSLDLDEAVTATALPPEPADSMAPPSGREPLLNRLRERARGMSADRVAKILDKKAT